MKRGFRKKIFLQLVNRVNALKKHGRYLGQSLSNALDVRNIVKHNGLQECSMITLVEKARTEWEDAKVFFNEAQDPALVDHAIYAMEAAERKYMYLLKEARQENLVHEDIYYVLHNQTIER